MRAILLVAAVSLLGAACGAVEDRSGGSTASTSARVDTGRIDSSEEVAHTQPPPIVLEAAAGNQEAIIGTTCVSNAAEGVSMCADAAPIAPTSLTVVRPGDEIRIVFVGTRVVRSKGCHGGDEQSCVGFATVYPPGCDGEAVATIPLAVGPTTTWKVDLPPGPYAIDVFAYFDSADGRSGDVSGVVGLRVDKKAPLEIVPAPDALPGC